MQKHIPPWNVSSIRRWTLLFVHWWFSMIDYGLAHSKCICLLSMEHEQPSQRDFVWLSREILDNILCLGKASSLAHSWLKRPPGVRDWAVSRIMAHFSPCIECLSPNRVLQQGSQHLSTSVYLWSWKTNPLIFCGGRIVSKPPRSQILIFFPPDPSPLPLDNIFLIFWPWFIWRGRKRSKGGGKPRVPGRQWLGNWGKEKSRQIIIILSPLNSCAPLFSWKQSEFEVKHLFFLEQISFVFCCFFSQI